MAEPGKTSGIGQRIKEHRRRRGYRSTTELAEHIPGGNVTASVLENIESGRKADLSVSQLLNIARALRVPPVYLLANVTAPGSSLDLPNLSDDLAEMTAGQFEAWFSGVPQGEYRSKSADERLDVQELDSYRMLSRLRRGLIREEAVATALGSEDAADTRTRISRIRSEIQELEGYLLSAGWDVNAQDEGRARTAD